MKYLIALCIAMIFLLSGCGNGDSEEKVSSIPAEELTIQTKSNIYEPDYFTDLYNKIGAKLGAADEDFMSFIYLDFYFSADGTVEQLYNYIYTKIPKVEKPVDIYSDYLYRAYKLDCRSSLPTEVTLVATDDHFVPDINFPNQGYNYARYREQMSFLTNINLKQLVSQYSVGAPTGFALRSQPISANYEKDFVKNGIFLDCTDPSDIRQIDRMAFSDTLPYDSVFDGVKYYYGIYPYYGKELTAKEMQELQHDTSDWDNIIVLMIRD